MNYFNVLNYNTFFRIAYTALEDHQGAYECYRKALELDPDNQSYQNNLEIAEQKLKDAAMQVRVYLMLKDFIFSLLCTLTINFMFLNYGSAIFIFTLTPHHILCNGVMYLSYC